MVSRIREERLQRYAHILRFLFGDPLFTTCLTIPIPTFGGITVICFDTEFASLLVDLTHYDGFFMGSYALGGGLFDVLDTSYDYLERYIDLERKRNAES